MEWFTNIIGGLLLVPKDILCLKSTKCRLVDRKHDGVHAGVEGKQLGDHGGEEADEAGVYLDKIRWSQVDDGGGDVDGVPSLPNHPRPPE